MSRPSAMPSLVNAPAGAATPPTFDGASLAISGSWLKVARIFDEIWLPPPAIREPAAIVEGLKASRFAADLFTFGQPVPDTDRKHAYPCEWENWAVAPTHDFEAWWSSLPQESRKNVRKAQKRGIAIRPVTFDDELVHGIKALYDETPLRQGRRFWHYGKDFETIKRENATYLDRSDFLGAYLGDELIGFIKIVQVGSCARIMQILAKVEHQDKHPTNALLASAMETCATKRLQHLIYGQYIYGNKPGSSVTEFKRRNGFQAIYTPRYYVPLSSKGRLALATRLHRPLAQMLPEPMLNLLLEARSFAYGRIFPRPRHPARGQNRTPVDPAAAAGSAP